jgi:hypothetical protein
LRKPKRAARLGGPFRFWGISIPDGPTEITFCLTTDKTDKYYQIMQARVVIFEQINEHDRPNEWCLSFQRVRYVYANGETEDGFRFIWIRPNGKLQAARGQARIPRISDALGLIQRAIERGWGNDNQ